MRHEGPFEYAHDSKTGIGICLRASVMSDLPFRRYRVSEVCHCGGFLLAFAASQKCRSDQSPATSKLLHECERSARDGLCLNGAPSLLARCRDFFGQGLRDDALST